MLYHEKLEQMVTKHFPETKAFETRYWLTGLVNPFLIGDMNTKKYLMTLMAAYVSGVLVGEGATEDEIAEAMDIELAEIEKEHGPLFQMYEPEGDV